MVEQHPHSELLPANPGRRATDQTDQTDGHGSESLIRSVLIRLIRLIRGPSSSVVRLPTDITAPARDQTSRTPPVGPSPAATRRFAQRTARVFRPPSRGTCPRLPLRSAAYARTHRPPPWTTRRPRGRTVHRSLHPSRRTPAPIDRPAARGRPSDRARPPFPCSTGPVPAFQIRLRTRSQSRTPGPRQSPARRAAPLERKRRRADAVHADHEAVRPGPGLQRQLLAGAANRQPSLGNVELDRQHVLHVVDEQHRVR